MSERLVTEADLAEPVCECGHREGLHGDRQCHSGPWPGCVCKRSWRDVQLAHLDSIVRREVAKALRGVDTDAMAEAWGDGSAWFTTGTHVAAVVRDWLNGDADEIESGGQS